MIPQPAVRPLKTAETASNRQKRRRRILKYVVIGHISLLALPLIFWGAHVLFSRIVKPRESIVVMLRDPARAKVSRSVKLKPPTEPLKKPFKPKPKAKPKPATPTKPAPRANPAAEPKLPEPPRPVGPTKPDPVADLEPVAAAPEERDGAEEADYVSILVSALYDQWSVPNDELINGRKLEVLVKFTVSAAGRITEWHMIKASDFRPLDNSVRNLMHHAQNLPKPPDGKSRTYEVIFTPE